MRYTNSVTPTLIITGVTFELPRPRTRVSEVCELDLNIDGDQEKMDLVTCPICNKRMTMGLVNIHLDKGCNEAFQTNKNHTSSPLRERQTQKTRDEQQPKLQWGPSSSPNIENSIKPTISQQQPKLQGTHSFSMLKRSEPDNSSSENLSSLKKAKTLRRDKNKPLAELIRPTTLDEYIGQPDLVGPKGILRAFIQRDACPSVILWGPSGVGKTTIARVGLQALSMLIFLR